MHLQEGDPVCCCMELLGYRLSHHHDPPHLPLILQPGGTLHHQARHPPLHLPPHPHRSLHHAEYHQVGSLVGLDLTFIRTYHIDMRGWKGWRTRRK